MWATENPQMMAFVRTGAIPYELIESLTTDARLLEAAVMHEDAPPVVARAQLRALTRHVQAYGPRGPVHGGPSSGSSTDHGTTGPAAAGRTPICGWTPVPRSGASISMQLGAPHTPGGPSGGRRLTPDGPPRGPTATR
jgi:hypothetical protein